jgi:hypothetical protein
MPIGLDVEIHEDQYRFFNEQGRTRVVNIKDDPSIIRHPDFVYIGRYNSYYNLPQSKWANLYHIGVDGTREQVILKYEMHLPPMLRNSLHELKGKILGCWCKPLACHGDVLVRLAEAL